MEPAKDLPTREDPIAQRMRHLRVREEDLEETFVRSGGHGGQNVNKTATCVILLHRPTGLQVKCQTARTQGANRFLARVRLLDKLEAAHRERQQAQQARREKVRRTHRGRSRAAKERILAAKAKRSARKANRRHVAPDRDA